MEPIKDECLRAFLAIPIDDSLRAVIARLQKDLGAELHGVRWSRTHNLHLTLRFFAEIEAESLEKAAKLMLSVGALGAPFTLCATHLGAFPSSLRPRVLWLGFAANPALHELYRQLEALLGQAGIPAERRPFRPHLTLGRTRGKLPDVTTLLTRYGQEIEHELPVDRLVLYHSRLLPQGAEHSPLYTFELADSQP